MGSPTHTLPQCIKLRGAEDGILSTPSIQLTYLYHKNQSSITKICEVFHVT